MMTSVDDGSIRFWEVVEHGDRKFVCMTSAALAWRMDRGDVQAAREMWLRVLDKLKAGTALDDVEGQRLAAGLEGVLLQPQGKAGRSFGLCSNGGRPSNVRLLELVGMRVIALQEQGMSLGDAYREVRGEWAGMAASLLREPELADAGSKAVATLRHLTDAQLERARKLAAKRVLRVQNHKKRLKQELEKGYGSGAED